MRKLTTVEAARLVKQKNNDWYIVWYNQNPPERFRKKFGLNRIKDLTLRQQWADEILNFINSAALTGISLTPDAVEKHFATGSTVCIAAKATFSEHVERFIALRENVLENGTVKVFRTTFNNLKGFAKDKLKKEAPDFEDFDIDFPLRFQSWCYAAKRKHSRNYVAKLVDVLRQFLRDAEEHELPVGKAWKTKKYVIGRVQVDEIALSSSEVEKLHKLDLKGLHKRVRDVFVFACLTGFRFSDVTRIEEKHILRLTGGVKAVKIDTQKTGEKVIVPLHPFALDILDRNSGTLPAAPCNQVFNRELKNIGELAHITEGTALRTNVAGKQRVDSRAKFNFITTHTARRTFATIAYMEYQMPVVLIMKITGHRTEKEFFKYIRISQEQAALEMAKYMKS